MKPIELTETNFEQEVLKANTPVLVDFWAVWCGPCRIQGPILEALTEKFSNEKNIKIAKLDVDENNNTSMQYKILSIPTIAIFKDGELMETLVGLRRESELEEKITSYSKS